MRDIVLKELESLIFDTIKRCSAKRYRSSTNPANHDKIRQGYINSLAGLVRAYNQLLRDKEIDEIQREIELLKEEQGGIYYE